MVIYKRGQEFELRTTKNKSSIGVARMGLKSRSAGSCESAWATDQYFTEHGTGNTTVQNGFYL